MYSTTQHSAAQLSTAQFFSFCGVHDITDRQIRTHASVGTCNIIHGYADSAQAQAFGRGYPAVRPWPKLGFNSVSVEVSPPLSAPARLTVDTCRHMRERPAAIRSVSLRPWCLSMLLPLLLFRWLASVPCVVCPSPCREQTIGRRRKARCHASLSPAEVNPGLLLLLLSSTCGVGWVSERL